MGEERHNRGDDSDSIPFFKKAIDLDPNFALAYARLGTVYGNIGEIALGNLNLTKAFELRDRASEREKMYITAHYYDGRSLQKGMEAYELYRQTYPRDSIPSTNLGIFYLNVFGNFQKALEYELEAIRIDPDSYNGYGNAAEAYQGLGRLDEAQAILEAAVGKKLGGTQVHLDLGEVAIARGDWPMLERENTIVRQGWPNPFSLFLREAHLAVVRGQMRKAREGFQRATQSANQLKLMDNEAGTLIEEATSELLLGYTVAASERARRALALSSGRRVRMQCALLLGLAGEGQRADELLDENRKEAPDFEILNFRNIPTAQASVALHRHDPQRAIELLKPAAAYDGHFEPALFIRASAYMQVARAPDAVQEFQKILRLRTVDPLTIFIPLSQLGLARAYAVAGDKDKARGAYQDLFALWKDADPDIPVFIAAKSEYAKLK